MRMPLPNVCARLLLASSPVSFLCRRADTTQAEAWRVTRPVSQESGFRAVPHLASLVAHQTT